MPMHCNHRQQIEAKEAGYVAFHDGSQVASNPYPEGDHLHDLWLDGFIAAGRDAKLSRLYPPLKAENARQGFVALVLRGACDIRDLRCPPDKVHPLRMQLSGLIGAARMFDNITEAEAWRLRGAVANAVLYRTKNVPFPATGEWSPF